MRTLSSGRGQSSQGAPRGDMKLAAMAWDPGRAAGLQGVWCNTTLPLAAQLTMLTLPIWWALAGW